MAIQIPGRCEASDVFGCCRVKQYQDGTIEIMASDRPIFRAPGFEAVSDKSDRPRPARRRGSGGADDRAQRRARSKVRDICHANPDLCWFVTLTLDAARVDRYDVAQITRKLNAWLDNQVRRRGLRYVLVAERHKDGAVHFHGLFNDALERVHSGTYDCGSGKPRRPRSAAQRAAWDAAPEQYHPVYNLPGWTLGFTTAIAVYGERSKAVEYVCKYIGKGKEKVGGRWYYSGGQLQQPEVVFPWWTYEDVLQEHPDAYVGTIEDAGCCIVIWRGTQPQAAAQDIGGCAK